MLNKNLIGAIGIAVVAAISVAVLAQWSDSSVGKSENIPQTNLVAQIVEQYPHDSRAFTQGLAIHDGQLFESTGQYGQSSLRRVDLPTGEVIQRASVNSAFFAEGIAVLDNRIYQLTWRRQTGVIYDIDEFKVVDTFEYDGEGWGLTDNGTELILSDGTARIRFLNTDDFSVVRTIDVHDDNGPISRLNELEYIQGEIWANVWYEDIIVRIDPASGRLVGTIDISNVYPAALRGSEDVANGIAYDSDSDKFYITGKYWPALYEISLVPAD